MEPKESPLGVSQVTLQSSKDETTADLGSIAAKAGTARRATKRSGRVVLIVVKGLNGRWRGIYW
jgi:hypothetical protein